MPCLDQNSGTLKKTTLSLLLSKPADGCVAVDTTLFSNTAVAGEAYMELVTFRLPHS